MIGALTVMKTIFVYGDSLSWGIVPGTRKRLAFAQRWPGVMEAALGTAGVPVRVLEDCLNGRRTVWDDPYKPGRNGLAGLEQRMEVNAPLDLVIIMLGTNDFQVLHQNNAWLSGQGVAALVGAIRRAPIEPGMAVPPIMIMAPPEPREAQGAVGPKFAGAPARAAGTAAAYAAVAAELHCAFFAAGQVVSTSSIDGVHLDAPEHEALGRAIAPVVARLL
jgi:lysophospholipase L1-like esterase